MLLLLIRARLSLSSFLPEGREGVSKRARTCFGWRTIAPLDMTYVGMTILPTTAPLSPTTAPLHISVYMMTSGAQLSGSPCFLPKRY